MARLDLGTAALARGSYRPLRFFSSRLFSLFFSSASCAFRVLHPSSSVGGGVGSARCPGSSSPLHVWEKAEQPLCLPYAGPALAVAGPSAYDVGKSDASLLLSAVMPWMAPRRSDPNVYVARPSHTACCCVTPECHREGDARGGDRHSGVGRVLSSGRDHALRGLGRRITVGRVCGCRAPRDGPCGRPMGRASFGLMLCGRVCTCWKKVLRIVLMFIWLRCWLFILCFFWGGCLGVRGHTHKNCLGHPLRSAHENTDGLPLVWVV